MRENTRGSDAGCFLFKRKGVINQSYIQLLIIFCLY